MVISDTVSLQVASTKQVSWSNLVLPEELVEGRTANFSIDLENSGNTPMSHRIEVSAPEGWEVTATNHQMVELQPGEERTLTFEVRADSPGLGTITLWLAAADDVTGSSHEFELNATDDPNREVSSAGGGLLWGGALLLILILVGGIGVAVVSTRKESSPFDSAPPGPSLAVSPAPITEDLPSPPMGNLAPLAANSLSSAPGSTEETLPPPPVEAAKSGASGGQSSATGFGSYPLPPPPTAQPAKAPSADAFSSAVEADSSVVEAAVETSEEAVEEMVEEVVEEAPEEAVEGVVGATTEGDESEEEAEDGQSRHKCWVCLEGLSEVGWQACPSCGARYHLSGSGCAIDSLKGCRNCEGAIDNFVKVE
jgi:hypothetical protein